jgi:hypothetical protein
MDFIKTVSLFTTDGWLSIVPGDFIMCPQGLLLSWPPKSNKIQNKHILPKTQWAFVISIICRSENDLREIKSVIMIEDRLWYVEKRNIIFGFE